jgi:hypothetical protein
MTTSSQPANMLNAHLKPAGEAMPPSALALEIVDDLKRAIDLCNAFDVLSEVGINGDEVFGILREQLVASNEVAKRLHAALAGKLEVEA